MPLRNRLADRVHALLEREGRCGERSVETCAEELGVGVEALRDVTLRRTKAPALEVLEAVVRHYGVDPTWLIAGRYDARTHRLAGDGETAADLRTLMSRLLSDQWQRRDMAQRKRSSNKVFVR